MLSKRATIFFTIVFLINLFSSCQVELPPIQIPADPYNFERFKSNEMMIITVNKYVNELQSFIEFKKSLGMHIELNTTAAPLGIEAIQSAIRNKYFHGGLQYIILVGDIEEVPTYIFQDAPSDPSYTLLEGDDLIGDALISRISVKNPSELKNLIRKLIFYQKGEFLKKDWISNSIVVGTHEFDGVNHTTGIANFMRSKTSFFKNVVQILQTDQNPHEELMKSIESVGANMIVFNSHGLEDGFYSIEFRNKDLSELLTFGGSFPFIHGAACSTGGFQWSQGDCFAEAALKAGTYEKPAGAIGMLGFSRSTRADPAMIAQRIAFKDIYYNEKITTIGELCYFSSLLAMKEFDKSISEPFFKHWHLFGDCSMPIWKQPR